MSVTKQQTQEAQIMEGAVQKHDPSGRRQFFVSAGAFGAALAAPAAMAQSAASAPTPAPAAARKALLKDDSRLLNIGATVRSGNYWNFSTFITPVEEFYVRNHYPTPLVEQRPVLDPRNWKMKIL